MSSGQFVDRARARGESRLLESLRGESVSRFQGISMTRWLTPLACALMAGLAPCSASAQERVRAWEEDVVIPTYEPYPDDVNPKFFELEGSIIYPYSVQDNLSATRADKTYRGVFLMALPQIGRRIQTTRSAVSQAGADNTPSTEEQVEFIEKCRLALGTGN